MTTPHQSRDPLHGITLATILQELQEQYGWEQLGQRIPIRCFLLDPSISSSLKFLRRTPWARKKVESLYLDYKSAKERAAAESLAPAEPPPDAAAGSSADLERGD